MLPRFDVVLTSSPSITSGLISAIAAKIKKAKSIYNVQEIYPDVLIKHMEIRQKWLISLMGQIEKITYRLTNKIVTIDQCFSDRIQNRLDPKKLSVIPNFIDTTIYKPYIGEIRSDFSFNDKFLVGYLGNLGGVQDWDCILEAIQLLETDDRFHFLIAGGGSEYNRLRDASNRLTNLTVLPYQPRTSIPELNHRINLHMIAMDAASDYDGLPSKVYAILASGRPIIASSNADSPLSIFLSSTQFARIVKRGDPNALAKGIQVAFTERLHLKSSIDVRSLIENNYSKDVVTRKYVELANQLIIADA
jgi:glycosyltransferase involved in cell wall biosynthesis